MLTPVKSKQFLYADLEGQNSFLEPTSTSEMRLFPFKCRLKLFLHQLKNNLAAAQELEPSN